MRIEEPGQLYCNQQRPMEARASPAGITISLAASGFLPESAVEHTDELVGRGASGLVRKGTVQPKGGGARLPVAIKELVPGSTEREEVAFMREFELGFNSLPRSTVLVPAVCMAACTAATRCA